MTLANKVTKQSSETIAKKSRKEKAKKEKQFLTFELITYAICMGICIYAIGKINIALAASMM